MGVKSIFLRTDFPESWFWTSYTMKNHMFLAISGVIPHTITSWYVTGFALSPTRGLGLINEPAKLTVSKPFYMIANLPYSIKRNEIARIQVTLFNFKSTEMTVDVTLFNKANEIEFVDRKSNDSIPVHRNVTSWKNPALFGSTYYVARRFFDAFSTSPTLVASRFRPVYNSTIPPFQMFWRSAFAVICKAHKLTGLHEDRIPTVEPGTIVKTVAKRRKKAVVVSPYASASISFLIKAKKLGVIAIKIEAASQSTTDGLERMLHVTPESRLFKKSEAEFVNLHSHDKQEFDIHLTIPEVVDNDSVKILVVVDAPSLGTVAQNLNNLFAIPTGAGSLNLLTFIPNVVVLDYIKETCKNKSVTEENAISYLSSGYKNQLKYRHSNGAFGQWEPPEKEPSVFLTALVANAFSTATKHIEIDQTVITDAFSWIKGKQKSNGCFEEDGEKIYEPMQNSSSSFALTAFIVAAIKENENIATQFSELVEKATNCLADNFYSLTNTHDIALATYALSLTGHANREAYLSILIQDSHNENNERYWKEDLKVEIAGYALLSYLAQNMYHEAIPIMKWLNKQRYSTGAFAGVHSTFVALKALGKMATYLNKRHHDYTVHVRYDDHHQSFGVVHSDSLVPIYHEIPGDIRVIDFEVVGTGFGLLQVTYEYFLNIQASIARPAFNLDVNVLDTSTSEIQYLHVCLSYIDREVYTTSGLTLVEVYLPSGLVVHENAVKDQSRRIKRTERAFHNTAMFVYYNEVSTNQECFEVTAHRKYQIALHRPAYVVVYDTNDMDKYAVKSYEGKVLQPCQICDRDDCRSMNC